MSRVSFRPRPVDVAKQLSIVRDVNELDNADGLLGAAQLQGDEVRIRQFHPTHCCWLVGQVTPPHTQTYHFP